ncbi:unnamed protein product [Penicillium crustosum]
MARPPQNKHPAATTTELPTLNSTPSITRSITSYSMPRQKDPLVSSFGNATDATNDQIREYHHQVKATLTNILNDDRIPIESRQQTSQHPRSYVYPSEASS